MIRQDEIYKIGQLGKPHGIKGEITFSFTTDVWDRVEADYLVLSIDGIFVPFFLEEYRFRGEHSALLKFQNIDSIEDAQEISGAEVYFPYSLTPEDGDADYTWSYFEGFHVHDEKTGDLGSIVRVDESTENVLFELESGHLLPAVEAFITDIDHEGRTIHMNLPEGLLEI
ncbi:MAG: 16S rRNA processing protein RimM [Bacteroidaceae bacterium]|nr:16S rRNA processing protein RimM [Bacteroidaceae bacterium]